MVRRGTHDRPNWKALTRGRTDHFRILKIKLVSIGQARGENTVAVALFSGHGVGQRLFRSKLIVRIETDRQTHTGVTASIALTGPLKCSVTEVIGKYARQLSEYSRRNTDKLEMWANAQRDGRPAEYRCRPLSNAAKFG